MARQPHVPSDASRALVRLHVAIGTTREVVAKVLGIDLKTLRKYYSEELALATAQANATIGGALFNKAKGGDTTAMIFWLKTRARWREKEEVQETDTVAAHLRAIADKLPV